MLISFINYNGFHCSDYNVCSFILFIRRKFIDCSIFAASNYNFLVLYYFPRTCHTCHSISIYFMVMPDAIHLYSVKHRIDINYHVIWKQHYYNWIFIKLQYHYCWYLTEILDIQNTYYIVCIDIQMSKSNEV